MVLFENIQIFNSRSEHLSLFKLPFFRNPLLLGSIVLAQLVHIGAMYVPVLKDILELEPVSIREWFFLLGIAFILLIAGEAQKYFLAHTQQQPAKANNF